MTGPNPNHGGLEPLQAEVARLALAATEHWFFALAGGNALVAHGMLARPTQDVDLFTTTPGGPGQAAEIVTAALQSAGLVVTSEVATDGDFARLRVSIRRALSWWTERATGGPTRQCGWALAWSCTATTLSPPR